MFIIPRDVLFLGKNNECHVSLGEIEIFIHYNTRKILRHGTLIIFELVRNRGGKVTVTFKSNGFLCFTKYACNAIYHIPIERGQNSDQ